MTITLAILMSVGLLVAQPAHAAAYRYVALGDSVAAGAGLPSATTATNEDKLCGRSPEAYPTLLAAKLGVPVTNLTCSGAKDGAGVLNAQTVTSGSQRYTLPSQLDRAFQGGVPDLITMTVGANDLSFSLGGKSVGWTDFLSRCFTSQCDTAGYTLAVKTQSKILEGKLAYTLREIKKRSGTHTPPRVLITEYYYPISSTACLPAGITASEANWINNQVYTLNNSIRQSIEVTRKLSSYFNGTYDFAYYVPINFNGHGLCSADSWVQGFNDPAPIHPTATGAAVYADSIFQYAR